MKQNLWEKKRKAYLIERERWQSKLLDLCNWITLDVRKHCFTKKSTQIKHILHLIFRDAKYNAPSKFPPDPEQSFHRGRTKMTWNVQEYVSSDYWREGNQGSRVGGHPERHREYQQRGSRTHLTVAERDEGAGGGQRQAKSTVRKRLAELEIKIMKKTLTRFFFICCKVILPLPRVTPKAQSQHGEIISVLQL